MKLSTHTDTTSALVISLAIAILLFSLHGQISAAITPKKGVWLDAEDWYCDDGRANSLEIPIQAECFSYKRKVAK